VCAPIVSREGRAINVETKRSRTLAHDSESWTWRMCDLCCWEDVKMGGDSYQSSADAGDDGRDPGAAENQDCYARHCVSPVMNVPAVYGCCLGCGPIAMVFFVMLLGSFHRTCDGGPSLSTVCTLHRLDADRMTLVWQYPVAVPSDEAANVAQRVTAAAAAEIERPIGNATTTTSTATALLRYEEACPNWGYCAEHYSVGRSHPCWYCVNQPSRHRLDYLYTDDEGDWGFIMPEVIVSFTCFATTAVMIAIRTLVYVYFRVKRPGLPACCCCCCPDRSGRIKGCAYSGSSSADAVLLEPLL